LTLAPADRVLVSIGALFALFVAGVAPSVDWLDSGSLLASAFRLGVAHPPGEPGWLAPARIAQLLPVGDLAFRVNVLCALFLAAAAWPLVVLTRAAIGHPAWRPEVFVVGVGLLGYGARMQGNRAEVYGLVALLLLGALAAAVADGGRRSSALLGLLLGLAATVHPLLAAAATPALLLARWMRGGVTVADAGHAVGWGLVGFAAYGWLPVRALARPADAWGVPSTVSRFLDVLLARNFARNFGGESAGFFANLGVVLERHMLSGLGVLLVLALCAWLLRDGKGTTALRALAWSLPVWLVGNALTILPQNKAFGSNPDVLGYLLVGVLAAAPLGAHGLHVLATRRRGSSLERLGPLLLVVAWLVLAFEAFDGLSASRTRNELARQYSTALAAGTPPGSVLVASGNDTAFTWAYLQGVEYRRPDLIVVPRVLLGHAHQRIRLEERLRDVGIAWSPRLRDRPVPELRGATRPAFVEMRSPEENLALPPHGLVVAVRDPGPEPASLRALRVRTIEALEGDLAHGDPQAALVAAYFRTFWGPL